MLQLKPSQFSSLRLMESYTTVDHIYKEVTPPPLR